MADRRDADIGDLLNLVARAHIHMVMAGQWDWVVRADSALALTPRPRTTDRSLPRGEQNGI